MYLSTLRSEQFFLRITDPPLSITKCLQVVNHPAFPRILADNVYLSRLFRSGGMVPISLFSYLTAVWNRLMLEDSQASAYMLVWHRILYGAAYIYRMMKAIGFSIGLRDVYKVKKRVSTAAMTLY